jgi:hypothetical protein
MLTLKSILKAVGLAALLGHAKGNTNAEKKYSVHKPAYNPAMENMSYFKKNGSGGRSKHPGWSTRKNSGSKRQRNLIEKIAKTGAQLSKATRKRRR